MTRYYGEEAPYGIRVKSEYDMLFAFDTEEERDAWVMRDEFHRFAVETTSPYIRRYDLRGVITWREWCEFKGIED